jgi:hypothetical protein
MSDWVEGICGLVLVFRTGDKSIRQLFEPACPHLDDRDTFLAVVSERLRQQPGLIDAWVGYCDDKRTDRGPYLRQNLEEVGFFDQSVREIAGRHQVVRLHSDPVAACADFIYREAVWVLRGVRAN